MTILNKVRAIPIRLALLTVLTLSLAGVAASVAVADDCSIATAMCSDGSGVVYCVSCGAGQTAIASCFCDWSAGAGYYNCQSTADCYYLYAD